MKNRVGILSGATRILAAVGAVTLAVAGCSTAPQSPIGAAEVRARLGALQSNPTLASKAPVEIREAESALLIAETPVGKDVALSEHRVYMADQLVEIAYAKAATRSAESERAELTRQREQARLDARTSEADRARREAAAARRANESAQAAAATNAELAARKAAEANRDADAARRKAEEMQRQIDELEAEATDRGLVLTLGDVLFNTGRSDLTSGGNRTLDRLIAFLKEYPERTVTIEGHTDDVGSLDMNQVLSQHRADSVKSYLVAKGVLSSRLAASGLGETQPIADNGSESGRQRNRRVEIIVANSREPIAEVIRPTM